MAGMWVVRPMNLNCITPGCSAGIISYGHGLTVTADPIIDNRCWNEADPSLMVFCTSLARMVPIPRGGAPSCTGLRRLLPLLWDTSSKSHQTIPDCFAASPAAAFVIFMTADFLILRITL